MLLADRLEVLLRDREQHAAEVVLDERGDRGQQRAERVDEPLGLLVVGEIRRAQRRAHVAVEQRDRLLGDVVRRVVVLAGEREQVGEREAGLEQRQPGAHDVDVARRCSARRRRGCAARAALRARPLRAARAARRSARPARRARGTPRAARRPATATASGASVASRSPLSTRPISASVRPWRLELADAGQALEVLGPVPGDPALALGRRQQLALLVEADRVDRHVGPLGQLLDPQPVHAADSRSDHSHGPDRAGPARAAPGAVRSLFQTGLRFSAKAVAPSTASPLAKICDGELVGALPAVGLGQLGRLAHELAGEAHRDRRVLADALGERARLGDHLVARRRPGSRGRARARGAASIGSPVIASSSAIASGTRLGSRMRPPAAAMRPRCTSGMPKRAVSAATTRSHDSTISNPPASAGPFTARDDRLREVAGHDAREPALAARDVHAAALRDDLEVGAGGEHLARAGEHDGAQRGVGLDLVEEPGHRLADLGADRVARVGPVEREERDVAAPFEFDECHALMADPNSDRRVDRGGDAGPERAGSRASRPPSAPRAPIVVARRPTWSASLPWMIEPSG